MKKILAKIFVLIVLVCGAAVAFSACYSADSQPEPSHTNQPSEDSGNDKNNENEDKNDHNNDKTDNNGGGIWTPPVKE